MDEDKESKKRSHEQDDHEHAHKRTRHTQNAAHEAILNALSIDARVNGQREGHVNPAARAAYFPDPYDTTIPDLTEEQMQSAIMRRARERLATQPDAREQLAELYHSMRHLPYYTMHEDMRSFYNELAHEVSETTPRLIRHTTSMVPRNYAENAVQRILGFRTPRAHYQAVADAATRYGIRDDDESYGNPTEQLLAQANLPHDQASLQDALEEVKSNSIEQQLAEHQGFDEAVQAHNRRIRAQPDFIQDLSRNRIAELFPDSVADIVHSYIQRDDSLQSVLRQRVTERARQGLRFFPPRSYPRHPTIRFFGNLFGIVNDPPQPDRLNALRNFFSGGSGLP